MQIKPYGRDDFTAGGGVLHPCRGSATIKRSSCKVKPLGVRIQLQDTGRKQGHKKVPTAHYMRRFTAVDKITALSFVELMELRVVKSFIDRGISLQRVRIAGERAMKLFNTPHPFATRRVFSGGKSIFAELTRGADIPDVVELTKNRDLQISSGVLLAKYLDEISFSDKTLLADRWWPLSRQFPVVLDPKIAFGAPVAEGTATRTEIVAAMAKAASTDVAANVYRLTTRQVQAAVQFEDLITVNRSSLLRGRAQTLVKFFFDGNGG